MRTTEIPQEVNLLKKIRERIANEDFRFSKHALQRKIERSISEQDAIEVLINGYHEKKKTTFDSKFQTWKYAIRGKTEEGLELRVIVALVETMVIITVIGLTREKPRRKM